MKIGFTHPGKKFPAGDVVAESCWGLCVLGSDLSDLRPAEATFGWLHFPAYEQVPGGCHTPQTRLSPRGNSRPGFHGECHKASRSTLPGELSSVPEQPFPGQTSPL